MVWTPAPGMPNAIVSSPATPAAHSPAAAPDAVFVFAAMIASRSVHTPSLAAASDVLLTVIVAARGRERREERHGACDRGKPSRVDPDARKRHVSSSNART